MATDKRYGQINVAIVAAIKQLNKAIEESSKNEKRCIELAVEKIYECNGLLYCSKNLRDIKNA